MKEISLLQIGAIQATAVALVNQLQLFVSLLDSITAVSPAGSCPKCGSKERIDLTGMGGGEKEYECKECGERFS